MASSREFIFHLLLQGQQIQPYYQEEQPFLGVTDKEFNHLP